jgi:hypothetical protein
VDPARLRRGVVASLIRVSPRSSAQKNARHRLSEHEALHHGPGRGLDGVSGADSAGLVHELEAPGREPDVETAALRPVHAVQRQASRRCARRAAMGRPYTRCSSPPSPPRCAGCGERRRLGQAAKQVAVEADLALPVGDDRAAVALLDLADDRCALGDPRHAVALLVGGLDLVGRSCGTSGLRWASPHGRASGRSRRRCRAARRPPRGGDTAVRDQVEGEERPRGAEGSVPRRT